MLRHKSLIPFCLIMNICNGKHTEEDRVYFISIVEHVSKYNFKFSPETYAKQTEVNQNEEGVKLIKKRFN